MPDETSKDAKFGTEQIKTALLVLPLAGTFAAVTFDVGCFGGVDVNYFPIF
jgi:hypothetical protein